MQNAMDSRDYPLSRDTTTTSAPSSTSVSPDALERPTNNLPHLLSSFIGRAREIAEVKRLLSANRLITLTGPGGSGKTRLAIEVAADMVTSFDDGVWFVDLAPLADAAFVPEAVAAVLGVREQQHQTILDSLTNALHSKHLLLVLDNCEHVIDACARLADTLLRTCPDLSMLATSREALGITGESARRVPPLSLPDPREKLPLFAELSRCEAVQLFVDRAVVVEPRFKLNEANAVLIATICQRLDGIPLAIELAAARVKVLQPADIAERLNDRFRLLTLGSRTALPRHQTLHAAIAWSYDLLTEPERLLLRRLSVFAGGWTFEAAEAVCSDEESQTKFGGRKTNDKGSEVSVRPPSGFALRNNVLRPDQVLDFLSRLVDKSLVIVDHQGAATHYHLLETIRQYAGEKLLESGEEARVRDRHFDFFLQFAQAIECQLYGGDQFAALDRFHAEYDNLRAAMDWWVAGADARGEDGLWLTGALRWFWFIRNLWGEGQIWYDRVLNKSGSVPASATAARAQALNGAAMLTMMQFDLPRAKKLAEQSLALSKGIGDVRRIGIAYWNLAACATKSGDNDTAITLSEQAISHLRQVGDHFHLAWALGIRGIALLNLRDLAGAFAIQEERVRVSRETGNAVGLAITLRDLGRIREYQGEYAQALPFFEEALTLFHKLDNQWGSAEVRLHLAELAFANRDYARATVLCQESIAITRALGYKGYWAWALDLMGIALSRQGEFGRAVNSFGASLELYQERNYQRGIFKVLTGLSAVAIGAGDFVRGVKLLSAVESRLKEIKPALGPIAQEEYDRSIAMARAQLDQTGFAQAWAEGQALALEQTISLALETTPAASARQAGTAIPRGTATQAFGGLTPREREVAVRVAQGMSNPEIAEELIVSRRTVETHVTNILNKLGFSSRAQIRKWANENGLVKSAS